MTDEQERQDPGVEPEAAHAPPISGEPEENPEELEEHLDEAWERPADEDKSPTETAKSLEAEGEAFEPPEDEPETEREAVEEAAEALAVEVEEEAVAELVAEESEPAAELEAEAAAEVAETAESDELSAMLARAGEIVEEAEAEAEAEEVEEPTPEFDLEAQAAELLAQAEQAEAEAAAEPAEEAEQAEVVEEEDDDRHWYVIHCYSGQENKVRHNLEQRIESMGMKDKIFDVVVPTEEEIEVKDGKRRTVERRVFPGYILVQMIITEESWYVVRNTPGVTGFVGMGNEPTPLRPEEVSSIIKRMEAEAPRIKVTYKLGQKVRIIDGPFNDFIGTVDDIDMDRAKVRVMVSFFGRETPVELDFLQVEKA